MLQKHTTCLQQHLINSTAATTNSTNSLNVEKAAKNQTCLNHKHENSLKTNNTYSKRGITVNPYSRKVKQQQFQFSNNVALHSLHNDNQENDDVDVDKLLATTYCNVNVKKRQNDAQENKWGFNKSIKPNPCLTINKLQNSKKAQILKQQQQQQHILFTQTATKQISNMLPAVQQQQQHYEAETSSATTHHENTIQKESLDFNSKRRRGRLRLQQQQKHLLRSQRQWQLKEKLWWWWCWQLQPFKDKYEAFKNVPATKYLYNVAKLTTTLLLTQILLFINKIKNDVNKTNIQQQQQQQPKQIKNLAALTNKKITHKLTTTTSSSCFSLATFLNKFTMYFYAFIFLTTLILLPYHYPNAMAEAAKPKSATQPQIHNNNIHLKLQREQEKPIIAYAAGADNVHIDEEGGTILTPPSYQIVSSQTSNEDETEYIIDSDERNFDFENDSVNEVNEEERDSYEKFDNVTNYENATVTKTPLFPTDLFTKEQLERGAVICHIIGVIYMFVALAIVCDEFFVPSLDVIIEKMNITDDVAGATFMAAGGSAPELFTSVIGVFVSFDDVGIGTIVGSAVFNILFVIGMCALFSRTVLTLTWWPLFRDCTFYSISLMVLIYFFRDNLIYWWEALILFNIYCSYVAFMKWNVEVETFVKRIITNNKVTRVRSTDQLMPAGNAANSSETSMATQPGGSVTSRAASESRSGPPGSSSGAGTTGNSSGGNASSTQTGAKFRHGLLQLMIHTIDPLHDGKVDEKATQLHAIASLKVLLDATKPQRGGATTSAANHVKINLKETTLADRPNGNIDTTLDSPSLSGRRASWIDQRVKIQTRKFSIKTQEIEDEPEPLSMAWPDTARKRLTYILVAPLLIPMWLTLPDTRTPKGKKLYPITFIGSILWIAAFSYLMVWWANVAGDTARIPPEVMGLTFLAAGTSIPDLITSVIVARKGFGDMAVSSSVGSNIFDVTVGLPIPWLLFGICYGAPVEVNSVGMVCSITILFMMLLFVVISIACFRWRMNKSLGFTMFLLYFVFVAVSLMFEYDVITCPV